MKASFKTTILNVPVWHCIDGEKEHYCVDAYGYLALVNWFLSEEGVPHKDITEVTGIVFYNKIPVRYNPKLDEGGPYGSEAENAEGSRASEVVP